MSALLAQRQLALAGIALLAGLSLLAYDATASSSSPPRLPEAVPAPGGGWFTALAASSGPAFAHVRRNGGCGIRVGPASLGIAHPVLPCKTRLYLSYGHKVALTQVIARGAYAPGRDFEVSPALAQKLDLHGTEQLKWRYAR